MNATRAQIEQWFNGLQAGNVDAAMLSVCLPREEADRLRLEAEEAGVMPQHYAGFLLVMAILRQRGQANPEAELSVERVTHLVKTFYQYVEMVDELRTAQRGYFRSRQGDPMKQAFYVTALKLEGRVDQATRELLAARSAPPAEAQQPELFSRETE